MIARAGAVLLCVGVAGCAWTPAPYTPKTLSAEAKSALATSTSESERTQVVRVRVKSFIAPIATKTYRAHLDVDPGTARRLGFAGSWLTQNAAREFMHAADDMFSENPTHGERTVQDYRLHSAKDIRVSCDGDRVAHVAHDPMTTDAGFDTGLKGTHRTVTDRVHHDTSAGTAAFVLHMRGQPPEEVEPAFEVITPRQCRSIWHRVEGSIRCEAGRAKVAITARGSAFPSHRVWVNGAVMGTLDQGPMESLWLCSENDPTLIR